MLAVKFYEDVKDELLRFAVVIAKHDGKWVFCKHKERETLEFPGGHRRGRRLQRRRSASLWKKRVR